MRRHATAVISFVSLGAVSALVYAHSVGASLLGRYTESLNKADSLSVEFTTQKPGDAPVNYSVKLAKPNLARIETAGKLIVADGKTITTYDKNANTYISQPETDADLNALLKPDELSLFAPFFVADAINTADAKDLGQKQLGGQNVEAIQFALAGAGHTATAYLSQDDALVRKAQIKMSVPNSDSGAKADQSRIISTQSISIGGKNADDTFAFKAPDGAKELTLADLMSDKWYTDLTEAESVAAKTGRKIFVDFMASWCGPCHMLHDTCLVTDEFKKYSKYLVFVQIDVDEQPSVFASYNGEAMPTQLILDAKGNVLDKMVGYGGPDAFYAFINKNVGS